MYPIHTLWCINTSRQIDFKENTYNTKWNEKETCECVKMHEVINFYEQFIFKDVRLHHRAISISLIKAINYILETPGMHT